MAIEDKLKRSSRRKNTFKKAIRQAKLGNRSDNLSPHFFHKQHALNCGNPNCVMCMNPRKSLKQRTLKEISFYNESFDE